MPNLQIELPMGKIEVFCRKWKIKELSVFGSALRADFRPDSDIDFLVTFADDAAWSLLDHAGMELELEAILNRAVDLISMRGIERSENRIRKQAILDNALSIYCAS